MNSIQHENYFGHLLIAFPKIRGFRELFLPENDFKTCSTVNFPKTHPRLGGLEINGRHEIES